MYAIAAIGLLTIVLSLIMIASPAAWSRGVLRFAKKPFFHLFEIASRSVLGAVLFFFAGQTKFPLFFQIVGGVFIFAALFLIIAGEKRHREFAVRSATFVKAFRPAGVVGVAFGVLLTYAAVS